MIRIAVLFALATLVAGCATSGQDYGTYYPMPQQQLAPAMVLAPACVNVPYWDPFWGPRYRCIPPGGFITPYPYGYPYGYGPGISVWGRWGWR